MNDESDVPSRKMAKFEGDETECPLVAPVELEGRLESLLKRATHLCKRRTENERETSLLYTRLADLFEALLNDELINEWQPQMHIDVNSKCKKVVDLCVCMMDANFYPVAKMLNMIFNPIYEFHTSNATRASESVPPGSDIPDEKLYARPLADPNNPQGWLVDLINRFGDLGGFIILLSRFQRGSRSLTIQMIRVLIQPFGRCHKLLTDNTILKYLIPIVERVQVILDALTVEKLQEEVKDYDQTSCDISGIIIAMKSLVSRMPEQEKLIRNLESLNLRLIFKLVEAIKDIYESYIHLDSDFSVEQWNYFLEDFPINWKASTEYTREKILELLQQWAKRYQDRAMIHRVLALLWDLVHLDDISTSTMIETLDTHAVVITYLNPRCYDEKIFEWLTKCVEEFKSFGKWSLPALYQFLHICKLYKPPFISKQSIDSKDVICRVVEQHSVTTLVTKNLMDYMEKARQLVKENPDVDEKTLESDGRYNHKFQVEMRLDVLTYLTMRKQSLVGLEHVKKLWQCLVEEPVFTSDREHGFRWFSDFEKLHIYFNRALMRDFFVRNILQLDPALLTRFGILCFSRFFMEINRDDEGTLITNDLIGKEYLWRVVTSNSEEIARLGFDLLKEMNDNVGSQLKLLDAEIHRIFIAECRNQLQIHRDTLSCLTKIDNFKDDEEKNKEIAMETRKIDRISKFMEDYINACG